MEWLNGPVVARTIISGCLIFAESAVHEEKFNGVITSGQI